MTNPLHALLLTGSPRIGNSNSEFLGQYLLDRLAAKDWTTRHISMISALRSNTLPLNLFPEWDRADLIILSCPLYIDCLPADVILMLQRLLEHTRQIPSPKPQRCVTLMNCGFLEAFHNDAALEIFRLFAHQAGLDWAGGMAMGAGELIDQQPLHKAGFLCRFARKALDLAAQALHENQNIPLQAVQLMAKPQLPRRLYILAANAWWCFHALKNHALRTIYNRPYLSP